MLPRNRSKAVRQIKQRVPGGVSVVRYERIKKSRAACAICKRILEGVRPWSKSRSSKRVARIFGGHLCNSCTTTVIKNASRVKQKEKNMEEVDLLYRPYVQQLLKK